MWSEEKMFEDGAEAAKGINGEWEEEHVAVQQVANHSVAGGCDGGGGITFVDSAEFLALVPHKYQKWIYKIKLLLIVPINWSVEQLKCTEKNLIDRLVQFICTPFKIYTIW